MIEDIKSFMKDIEMLNKKLDAQDKIINEQVLEIARLKEQLEYLRSNEYLNQVKWERNFNEELVKDLQQKIDKAIEYIEQLPFNDLTPLEVKVIYKILGEKENDKN